MCRESLVAPETIESIVYLFVIYLSPIDITYMLHSQTIRYYLSTDHCFNLNGNGLKVFIFNVFKIKQWKEEDLLKT